MLFRSSQACDQLEDGLPVTAMQLALAGLPENPGDGSARPWVGQTARALVEAMGEQRELLVLRGHEGNVVAAEFSPDGARIVSGLWDSTVRVTWIGHTKQELIEIAGARLPRELTDDERRRFHLATD
jgi:WD40 repeat protein